MTSTNGIPVARTLRWVALAGLILLLVLGPFALWGEAIEGWVDGGRWRGAGTLLPAAVLFGLLALDGLLPVPSSLVSTLLGALLGPMGGTLVGATAMTLGVGVSYALGRIGGAPVARRLVGDRGLRQVRGWLDRHGVVALAACRPVPVLAEASVIGAGLAGMSAGSVLAVTALANLGVSAIYATAGATVDGWGTLLLAFAAAIVVPALFLLLVRWLRGS